jgi:SprT protein
MTQIELHINKVVRESLDKANEVYGTEFPLIPVRHDIKGKCAGQFCTRYGGSLKYLRFNPVIAKDNKDVFDATIVHEVAHYVVHELNGDRYIRPHGVEWKGVMANLGIKKPKTCHSMNTDNVTTRKGKTFTYKCDCREIELTSIRHNRSLKGVQYHCNLCKSGLYFKK